jgi:GT2 family glycosyltransferase
LAVSAADPSIDSAYGARVSDAPNEKRLWFDPFDRHKLLKANFIGMSCFIHRRTLYERFGGFDEDLRALEDWDLALRYTQQSPARRLPILAVRYSATEGGVNATEPVPGLNYNKIARKWRET